MEEQIQIIENKMGESRRNLGVSVSFGKYENDALSWEKWSTFSPNKYLDEVGKFSTPGSVAQKKAFFEAHYKKIAAMKAEAELLDQQNPTESDPSRSESSDNHAQNSFPEVQKEDEECSEGEMQSQISAIDGSAEVLAVDDGRVQDEPVQVGNVLEPQHLVPSGSPIVLSSCVDKLEEAVLVNDESMKLVKQHFDVDLEAQTPQESEKLIQKPKAAHNVARKVNPTKVEKNSIGMKKKEASIIPKSPGTSATRLTKPKSAATATATSSLKKANASSSNVTSSLSSSKKKNHSVSESRQVAPMSLHLSMSMSSVNSDTASFITSSRRRSLFMEQMGDKDIVKRAFKTFQNRVNQLPSSDNGPKQLPTKASERKASTSMTYQKENERSRRAAEKIIPARGQGGPTWKSVSYGSLKGVGVDERRLKVGPTSVNLKTNERAERRKEFLKNLEEKSNAREAERSQPSSKSKEAKDDEMKKLRQNSSFKAKPMPSFYRAQGVSKSSSEKETIKTGTTTRPGPHR